MTPSERLDEILAKFFNDLQNDYARASYRKVNINASYLEARKKIIDLFMELACCEEMIKKLEEMR